MKALKENNNLDLDEYRPFIKEFHIYSQQTFNDSLFEQKKEDLMVRK
jgi:hypothetical protein